jgi:ATP-binding cassette subfamily B multidrug efflux pump
VVDFTYKSSYEKEAVLNAPTDWTLIKRLLHYLQPYSLWIAIAILFLMVAKAFEAAVPLIIGHLSQEILNPTGSAIGWDEVFNTGSLAVTLLIVNYVAESINVLIKNWVGQRALVAFRTDVFDHMQHLPITYFDRNPIGRLMTRTIHDVEQINQMFSESVIPLMGSIFLFIFVSIGVLTLEWRVALAFFCGLPILFLFGNRFRIDQRRAYEKVRRVVSAMNGLIQEQLMGVTTIRNLGLEEVEERQFRAMNADFRQAYVESIFHFSRLFAGLNGIQNLVLIFLFVLLMGSSTGFQVGAFFTCSLYVIMIFRPIADLAERYNVLQSAVASAARIFQVMDEEKEVSGERSAPTHFKSLSFENVWFAYQGEEWILKDVSFLMLSGESVALVGLTGMGKTTMMQLILRYYDIQRGVIRINGVDIREYSLETLRGLVAVVFQDPVIFTGSIAENVGLFNGEISEQRMNKAIDTANMGPFVRRFPEGMGHPIAARGSDLSAGERQLVSFARAIAYQRQLLVLDEATANIDVVSEKAIQDALDTMISKRSSLVIAHRLSTVTKVQRIIVLHKGEIRESGTHEELLRKKGLYEKLYRLMTIS